LVGERVYGCDVCQEVCPYNRKFSRELSLAAFAARPVLDGQDARSLATQILSMSQAEFSTSFKGSPMKRAKRVGLKRNAAVVLGNVGTSSDAGTLEAAMSDEEPLVRSHAAWALGELGTAGSAAVLESRLGTEVDPSVRDALRSALDRLTR
jgi:epoxyqueuosine reductase